jgi:hypothetical protein
VQAERKRNKNKRNKLSLIESFIFFLIEIERAGDEIRITSLDGAYEWKFEYSKSW